MAVGVAREGQTLMTRAISLHWVIAVVAAAWALPVRGQETPQIAPLPKQCSAPAAAVIANSPLPNIATALKERRKINILAIGATSASLRGPVSGGSYAVVKSFLETTFKGLDVEIVHRGVSGELARDAADRIRTEVALVNADLVLWQLGTADALARVPVDEFQQAVSEAIAWLKERKVDIILVGLRYARSMASDEHYQAVRNAIHEAAKQHNVLRIGRYEAQETMERIQREAGNPASEAELTEAGYVCLAEYLARAIAAGLFAKPAPLLPAPANGK